VPDPIAQRPGDSYHLRRAASVKRHGKHGLGESIQAILREFRAQEDMLREVRENETSTSAQRAAYAVLIAAAVSLLQLVLSWYVIAVHGDVRRRRTLPYETPTWKRRSKHALETFPGCRGI